MLKFWKPKKNPTLSTNVGLSLVSDGLVEPLKDFECDESGM